MTLNWRHGLLRLAMVSVLAWSAARAFVVANRALALRQAQRAELQKSGCCGFWHDEAVEDADRVNDARQSLTLSIEIAFSGLALIPITFGAAIWVKKGFSSPLDSN